MISTTGRYSPKTTLPNIFGESSWQNGPANYTVDDTFWPLLYFALSVPSSRVLIDLVDANTDIKSNVPHDLIVAKRDFSDWLPVVHGGAHRISATAAAAYPTLGPLGQFNYLVRNARTVSKELPRVRLLEFANGTRIPVGQYRVLIRALRPFGDPEKDEDYDAFVTVQFGWVD